MSSFRDVVIDQKREWQTLLDQSYVKRDVVMPSGVEKKSANYVFKNN
jgi:hypothetical protein